MADLYSGWLTHISGHPSAAGRAQDRESSPVRDIGAGRIVKLEGNSGGSNYFGAKRRKFFLGAPQLFSCAHPVFDGIRGTTIKVKQF